MTSRGGKRPGSGRKKGSVTRRTQEIIAAVAADGESPLEYMLRVMRTADDDKRRDAMAVAAAPFLHPRLAAIQHTGKDGDPIQVEEVSATTEELKTRLKRLAARAS